MRRVVLAAIAIGFLSLVSVDGSPAEATNHSVQIEEAMAGANGNANIQFVEMRMCCFAQNLWGPQGSETTGRARLVFFNAAGTQTGEFIFPGDPPSGSNVLVLIGTQAFADLAETPTPDFIISPLLATGSGKVCFKGNPNNPGAFGVNLCLSYGSFTGSTEGAGSPASPLPTTGASSLARSTNTFVGGQLNSKFGLGGPTPTNGSGEAGTVDPANPGPTTVSGTITLQGRTSTFPTGVGHSIAIVTMMSTTSTTSVAADGSFQFTNVASGTVTLTASADGYLSAERTNVVVAGSPVTVPSVQLSCGLVNSDTVNNINDVTATTAAFGTSPAARVDAQGRWVDQNGDGVVNINDITCVVSGFGLSSPRPWP